ncbi:putative wall-associated receptor kinase, galacturonan-binding domain-containing protein [Helianthus annuus]|nr:putative wall-associated receptor kinase, galacturonan-binding domain-containing protein [Helianthus annuus]
MMTIYHPHIVKSLISMEAYRVLFCILFFIPLLSSASSNNCQTSYCGQSFYGVRFPFRLIDQQPKNCGYDGFDLRCASQSTLLIDLPSSGEFSVRSIDYRSQTIEIYDPLNCLPARLLTFNLSNSPFLASNFEFFTLLSCPNDERMGTYYKPIDCLSNTSFSVLATHPGPTVRLITSNWTGCRISGHLRVPLVPIRQYDSGFTYQLDEDMTLTWGTPNCKPCEILGSSCGYASSNTNMTTCFSNLAGKAICYGFILFFHSKSHHIIK